MGSLAEVVCVLGSDTGVGKTTITRLLLRHAELMGLGVVALKPFSSGGREDAEALLGGQENKADLDLINPWHYDAPFAPLIAARMGGRAIPDMAEVVTWIDLHRQRNQLVLMEGVGGLLTPIAERFSMLDIIGAIGGRLVVVVRNRLGAINQARMCYVTSKQCHVAQGILVLSGLEDADSSARTNRAAIEEFCPQWTVLELPYVGKIGLGANGTKTIAKKFKKTLAQILQGGRNVAVLCETNCGSESGG